MGDQEQDTHKDTGSRWGQWEWGCGQGHQEQGGGTGSQTGTRTVEAGLQSASQEQDGDRDTAQAGGSSHKEMAAQGAVSCGDLPSPWDGDKQGQLGGSTQGHSLLMALLRVGAHPPGCVPELSPDPLMPRMEPPVPQCVIPRASVYLRHGPGRHSPWGILHPHRSFVWEIPAAWQGLGCTLERCCDSGSLGDAGDAMNRYSIWLRLTGTLCAQPGCHRCSKQCPCSTGGSTEVLQ